MDIFQQITKFDHQILLFIQEHLRFECLTPTMEFSSFLVNSGVFWIVLCLILIFFKKTRMIGVVGLTSIVFGFLVSNVILKNVIARARPYDTFNDLVPLIAKPRDFSFPSGHTTCSFAAAGILARFFNKPLAVVTVLFAVLVAYSRLYLGVHYPTDVLVGFLVGFCGSLIVYHFYAKRFDLNKYKIRKTHQLQKSEPANEQ